MELSETAHLLVSPFRTYERLRAGEAAPSVASGAAKLLVVVGTLVAVTSTGRLAPFELLTAIPSFAYILAIQAVGVAVVAKLFAAPGEVRFRDAYALYLAGHGPWLLALVAICAGCMLVDTQPLAFAPWLVLGAALWGGLLTYACFRVGLRLTRGRTWAAMGAFYLVLTACVLGYFVVAGQLLPILPGGG